jgi:hypothetical protein
MANYNETSLTGSEWQRASRVVVNNPYGGVPNIQFHEEKIAELSSGLKVNTPVGVLTEQMTDPSTVFNLVHPLTGVTVGSASYLELHVILHSLYLHLAAIRDTPVEA